MILLAAKVSQNSLPPQIACDPGYLTNKSTLYIAEHLGFTLSSVLNAFLKQFIRTKTVTFSIQDEMPNEHLKSVLKQAKKNLKEGKHSPIFDDAEDAIAWLHRDQ